MSITEAIAELERKRDIAIEMGFDPRGVPVLIRVGGTKEPGWEEMADSELRTHERGTMVDLCLLG